MITFDASEIFRVAIIIEENGEKFYRHFAQVMEDREAKNVFTYLADEEVGHKKIFEDMKSQIDKYEPPDSYPGEYLAYLRAYVDTIIFTQKGLEEELSSLKQPRSAIEFGIQRELDSILYYQEIKALVPQHQQSLIDKIIEEERKHFLKFSELHKLYEKGENV